MPNFLVISGAVALVVAFVGALPLAIPSMRGKWYSPLNPHQFTDTYQRRLAWRYSLSQHVGLAGQALYLILLGLRLQTASPAIDWLFVVSALCFIMSIVCSVIGLRARNQLRALTGEQFQPIRNRRTRSILLLLIGLLAASASGAYVFFLLSEGH